MTPAGPRGTGGPAGPRGTGQDGRVTRRDIEAKLAELQGDVEEVGESAKGPAIIIAGAVVVVLLGVAFLLGKRRGKLQTTTIEIRRV